MRVIGRCFTTALVMGCGLALAQASAADDATPMRFQIPVTVSSEASAGLNMIYSFMQQGRDKPPIPQTPEEWDQQNARREAFLVPFVQKMIQPLQVSVREDKLGRVPVLRVTPYGYTKGHRILIFTHGGGYVVGSARSGLVVPSLVADATGCEVISIDYTLAPHGTWKTVPDQVLSVYKAVLAEGYKAKSIGMFGDSAGGGLAAASVLKMRDQGIPLPGALYLLAPWADLTNKGDTFTTLAAADPTLDLKTLAADAAAYAAPADQTNPYVSPVYGDFSKPFPPTLIQGGTREVLVSANIRLYQAIRGGGHEAVLDLYEGMPHVFQGLVPNAPETKTSIARAAKFFQHHLAD